MSSPFFGSVFGKKETPIDKALKEVNDILDTQIPEMKEALRGGIRAAKSSERTQGKLTARAKELGLAEFEGEGRGKEAGATKDRFGEALKSMDTARGKLIEARRALNKIKAKQEAAKDPKLGLDSVEKEVKPLIETAKKELADAYASATNSVVRKEGVVKKDELRKF